AHAIGCGVVVLEAKRAALRRSSWALSWRRSGSIGRPRSGLCLAMGDWTLYAGYDVVEAKRAALRRSAGRKLCTSRNSLGDPVLLNGDEWLLDGDDMTAMEEIEAFFFFSPEIQSTASDTASRASLIFSSMVFKVNVFAAFFCAKHAARVMAPEKKGGVILFTASAVTETHGFFAHAYTS
ncbi:unnamed protein product, partial [Linum tenue]